MARSSRSGTARRTEPIATEEDHGALVTNPPYGVRLGRERDLTPLYHALGRLARALPETWRVALMCTDRKLGLKVDGSLRTAFLTDAGGLKVRALVR